MCVCFLMDQCLSLSNTNIWGEQHQFYCIFYAWSNNAYSSTVVEAVVFSHQQLFSLTEKRLRLTNQLNSTMQNICLGSRTAVSHNEHITFEKSNSCCLAKLMCLVKVLDVITWIISCWPRTYVASKANNFLCWNSNTSSDNSIFLRLLGKLATTACWMLLVACLREQDFQTDCVFASHMFSQKSSAVTDY